MQLINSPAKLVLPFATSGNRRAIPTASQIGITAGAASLTDGFPPLAQTPISAGGVPVSPLDMNGIFYELSAILRWANAGGGYPYDGTFANDANVGGYPKGARVMRSDGLGYWFNTSDNNVTDPEGAGAVSAGWVPDYTTGATAVTMTGSNVTLTALQYGKPIIIISGLLSANLNLIFPNIIGEWTIVNNTTGAFTITAKTAAGTGVPVAQSAATLVYGDATNIGSLSAGLTQAAADIRVQIQAATLSTITGTATAVVSTQSPATANVKVIDAVMTSSNGGVATTIASNGDAAKSVKQYDSTGAKIAPNWISGQYCKFEDDGTDWIHVNPLPSLSNSVQVRQTVASGSVDANGQANYLSIGTGLAVNLAATAVPITYNFAAGFGANGAVDYVGRVTADVASAWSGLTASTTNYLYTDRNTSTGALTRGASLYSYVASRIAPSAPATDQHWFDLSTKTMKRWSGSAWVVFQRVFDGECVTSGSVVTSVITYALERKYYGEQASLAQGTLYTKNHNIGSSLCNHSCYIECTTNDAASGYVVGDRMPIAGGTPSGGGAAAVASVPGGTRLTTFVTTGNAGSLMLINKTTGNGSVGTTSYANFKLVFDVSGTW